VRQVRLDLSGREPLIWTVLDAPSFDRSYRDPVYDAEAAAYRSEPAATLDFRLININETGPSAVDELVPRDALLLLRR
jgi:hypothetical protein